MYRKRVEDMKRNSNIELLRIIAMLFIVLSHYTIHNGISNYMLPIGFNRFLLETTTLGNIGVIIFILITGYFSIDKEKVFSFKKLFLLYFQVLFYSLIIYLIFILINKENFTINSLLKNLLPISYNNYWFINVYIVLYIFSPYINIFVNSLKRKQLLIFIILSLLLFSLLPMININPNYTNEFIQFIMFYIIGAYLKKYKDNFFTKGKNSKIVLIITSSILIFSVIFFDIIGTKIPFISEHSTYLYKRDSIISILFAVSLFSLFLKKKDKKDRIINSLSSCVLGVYLISDNYLVRNVLWTEILNISYFVNSNLLILHMLLSLVGVFTCCIIIDYIRIKTIDKIVCDFYLKLRNIGVYHKIKSYFDYIFKKISGCEL